MKDFSNFAVAGGAHGSTSSSSIETPAEDSFPVELEEYVREMGLALGIIRRFPSESANSGSDDFGAGSQHATQFPLRPES